MCCLSCAYALQVLGTEAVMVEATMGMAEDIVTVGGTGPGGMVIMVDSRAVMVVEVRD